MVQPMRYDDIALRLPTLRLKGNTMRYLNYDPRANKRTTRQTFANAMQATIRTPSSLAYYAATLFAVVGIAVWCVI